MSYSESVNRIMGFFQDINKIPRCSKHEEKIAEYLINWAKENNLEAKKDNVNNVVIKIPATKGFENKNSIAIQGHIDMVCEKTPDSKHDFSKDPIEVIIEGDWAKAKDTTLGADDGMAVAIGLAIASDKNIEHPEIELLFTADEETGMNGAKQLQPGFFESKKLINIDSEREGVFTIGCAGGEDTDITLPINYEDINVDGYFYEIKINGLSGGHSGIDINKPKANAIKLMIDLFKTIKDDELKLYKIEGGTVRNAIPKSATAVLYTKKAIEADLIGAFYKHVIELYPAELAIKMEFTELKEKPQKIIANSKTIIDLIDELPHGVYKMLNDEVVKISNNLAKIRIEQNAVKISTNQRSLEDKGIDEITKKIESIAEKYNAKYTSYNRYPSWQPNYSSEIVIKSSKIYEKLFGIKPKIEVIHAGLECGIIGSKNKGMEMISIGPTLKDVHTPNEKLYIPSLEKIWELLINMLKEV